MARRKVVVTGMGVVSPFGLGVERLMEGLYAGGSTTRNMRGQWADKFSDLNCWVAAPVEAPLNERAIPRHYRRGMGRTAILGHVAASEALAGAGLPAAMAGSGRMGISFGSTTGSVASMEQIIRDCLRSKSARNLAAGAFFQIMNHSAAANLAYAFGVRGMTIGPSAACATAGQAIGLAWELIAAGEQDVMLCGGCDELHPIVVGTLDQLQAASWRFNNTPERTPRPFDRERDGTVCGEGAGALVLEAEDLARARDARIWAELLAHASTTDGADLSESSRESIGRCLERALARADLEPAAIDYVNAHATGTIAGDLAEAGALVDCFGPRGVPVSSLKGALSHTLAASCAIETIATIRMAHAGELIPTRNLDRPGEGCEELDHITRRRPARVEVFLKDSFGFGGINSILVLRRNDHGAG